LADIPENSKLEPDALLHCIIENEKYIRIGQLASGLAHNLQSPLTAIKGYAQLIKVDRGEIEEVQLILNEVEQIQKITHNLMIRTRSLQDGSIKAIFLNDLISNELDFLQTQMLFKHKIQRHIQLDPELPVIMGVYSDLSQVVFNLLLNSIQAMVDSMEKNLTIETRHDETSIYIEVRDTREASRIRRRDLETSVNGVKTNCFDGKGDVNPIGSKLGLTVIQHYVDKYQGNFQILSDPHSTRSVVAIPIQPAQSNSKTMEDFP
jgi:two-component system NtrC family sensor kinase